MNKKIIEEFRKRINPEGDCKKTLLKTFNYKKREGILEYPESKYELDTKKVEDFINKELNKQIK